MRDQDLLQPLDLLMKTTGAVEAIEGGKSKFGRLKSFLRMSIKRLSQRSSLFKRERFLELHSWAGARMQYL